MALTVSPAIKVFALVAMVVALLMGGALFTMGGQETVAASEPLPVLPKRKKPSADANAKATAGAGATAKTPGAKKSPAPAKKRAKAPVVAKNGLPVAIAAALRAHDVVIVSLYGDGWKIDPLARDEAAAGARAAGAGFVALDVTSATRAAEALMLKYDTVFRSPAVLIFRRGGELALQLDGFRDRDTVAQAAANARP